MKNKFRNIVILLILSLFTFSVNAQTVEQLKKERKQLQKKIEQTSKKLQETQKHEKLSLKKLNVLNQGLIERKELIKNYSSEINILDSKINKLSNETQTLETELGKLKKDYTRLIQKAQINRNIYSKLMFVLSADNFDQSMRRVRYLHEFTAYEKQQGKKIEETQHQLKLKTDSLGNHKTTKVQAVKAKEVEASKLQNDQKKEKILLTDLQKREKNLSSEYQASQRKVNEINAKIERIIAEEIRKAEARRKAEEQRRIAAEAARKKAAEEARQRELAEQRRKEKEEENRRLAEAAKSKPDNKTKDKTKTETTKTEPAKTETPKQTKIEVAENTKNEPTLSTYEVSKETREENLLSGNFARNQGRLPWPVDRGSVSAHFGVHPHPVLKQVTVNNKGTYFQSPSGSSARAVYEGVVTSVFAIPGGGNAVIVQHGNYRSVYGNLSSVYVKSGQKVNAKQTIGKIYTDDENGKTELYFQIWNGRQLLNPESWIAR